MSFLQRRLPPWHVYVGKGWIPGCGEVEKLGCPPLPHTPRFKDSSNLIRGRGYRTCTSPLYSIILLFEIETCSSYWLPRALENNILMQVSFLAELADLPSIALGSSKEDTIIFKSRRIRLSNPQAEGSDIVRRSPK